MFEGKALTLVHFTTELSGGAGAFVRNLHVAMQGMGVPSLVLTRDRSELEGVNTIKPISRIKASFRSHGLNLVGQLGLLNNSYAMFGIEACPVSAKDILLALKDVRPSAFIFYWISYFVDFKTILALRQSFPGVPIVLTCTDEALLTGGCHYSHGCDGYSQSCRQCPATSISGLQHRISRRFVQRRTLIEVLNPIVIYPTSNIQDMGKRSSVMKAARSWVIPLGAVSRVEQSQVWAQRMLSLSRRRSRKLTLLVRSSYEFRKGCDLFVAGLKTVSAREADLSARLKVISIGDPMLERAGIDRFVEHKARGYVSRDELVAIYKEIDVFLVTSREDGGPLMTNECVAMGIYVISTPIGVARDLILSEREGCITRDISSDAISQALLSCLRRFEAHGLLAVEGAGEEERRVSLTFEGYIKSMAQLLNNYRAKSSSTP